MDKERIILIAGGSSIRQNQWNIPVSSLELWKKLEGEITIGLNYVYRYFSPTILSFFDTAFYIDEKSELAKLALIIGKNHGELINQVLPNTYLFPISKEWSDNPWKATFYGSNLVGVFAISLAIYLGFKNIYLLGYDWGTINGKTHFYQDEVDLKQRDYLNQKKYYGIGKSIHGISGKEYHNTSNYDQQSNKDFKYFSKITDVNIYNVSLESKITQFPKISYDEFYKIFEKSKEINQNEVRQEIRNFINEKIKS